jgi:2-hydroxychromene-2-carboxylate isomerase
MWKNTTFFFDFLSPFSYFCWVQSRRERQQFDSIKPVVLGRLLKAWEIKGPGEIEPKKEFLARFTSFLAKEKNIPYQLPKTHPFNPLLALRMSADSIILPQELDRERLIDLLWQAIWVEQIPPDDPEQLTDYFYQKGHHIESVIEQAYDRKTKQNINQNTKDAIEAGCFGVPSILFQNEVFWGQDSLEFFKSRYNQFILNDNHSMEINQIR